VTGHVQGDGAQDVGEPATLHAPAKLTLSLRVTGVRPDGMHLLDAEMVCVDLADTLTFERGDGLTVVDEVVGGLGADRVPRGADNLIVRTLELVGRRAQVRLVKRVPAGAGLGGGSADAAAVLRWAGVHDLDVAARLGADIPFCLVGGHARVRGVGEVVERLPFEDRRFVLLLPPDSVDTGTAYRAYDRRRDDSASAWPGTPYDNDLEAAALDVTPSLARWRDAFHELCGVRPRLAGSGAAWFVEGEPDGLGIAGRQVLELDGQRAHIVAVRTTAP